MGLVVRELNTRCSSFSKSGSETAIPLNALKKSHIRSMVEIFLVAASVQLAATESFRGAISSTDFVTLVTLHSNQLR